MVIDFRIYPELNTFLPRGMKTHKITHPPTHHQASKEAHKVRHQMKETQAREILNFKKNITIPGANNLQAVFVEKQIEIKQLQQKYVK